MDYHKISIQLTPDNQDFRDILMASMGDVGFESFVENENSVDAFIPSPNFSESSLKEVNFSPLFLITYTVEEIPDQNWNEVWEKNYFKPLLIAGKCLIRAPFHTDYPKAEIELVIEPKMAFGTGNHETTSLMIEHLLETDIAAKTVLDMGCGTGILAMLSSKQGALAVTAIDIDKWSYESTTENCEINDCTNVEAFLGDANLLGESTFDIIFANIHKNILLQDMEIYAFVLNEGGKLFMSGFYTEDLEDITSCAEALKLSVVSHKVSNNWVAASFSK
jgi:ribosomal protein L11 methyltransferase